jgi:tRNA(adenine34) deaminase
MGEALREAKKAFYKGEVPVGTVVVFRNEIIARAYNLRESSSDPTGHAEVIALRKASEAIDSWRLDDVTFYTNLEPCIMCMGALMQARVPRLVFGAFDPKGGAAGSLYSLHLDHRLNHRIEVLSEVRERESRELLQSFFKGLRSRKKVEQQLSIAACYGLEL